MLAFFIGFGKLVDELPFSFFIAHCSHKCAFFRPSRQSSFLYHESVQDRIPILSCSQLLLILSLTHNELVG